MNIIHKVESFEVMGACFEVYKEKGSGFLEAVYQELKAVTALTDEHRAQVQNYLRATGMRLGLLVDFGHYPKLEYERLVL